MRGSERLHDVPIRPAIQLELGEALDGSSEIIDVLLELLHPTLQCRMGPRLLAHVDAPVRPLTDRRRPISNS